jgi:cellulose synthase (UDP-forming)
MDSAIRTPAAVPSPRIAELSIPQKLLLAAFVAVAVEYLSWRPSALNPDAPIFSLVVYGAELFGFVTAILFLWMCWRLKERTPPPVPAGATVAVFIPTINESVEMLRRTLLAAKRMRHATEIWLLDDGNRPVMRALADELGCRYLARTENSHAKAGNLNHALKHTSAEYIAIFDADHAPAENFLSETLGFFRDPRVAFVQTPQDFYNLDSFQHRLDRRDSIVWSEQTLFFRVIQCGKDRLNAAFFCGSCAVIRRSALDDIGGFATGSVTEDIHTSIKLHKRGWKSVYYARSLAFGLAPATVIPFLKQRLRWGQGAMQVWRQEGVLTARGLSLGQRFSYLATMLAYFEGWQRAVLFLAPVVVLTTGIMPLARLDGEFLVRFIPYYVLTFWTFEEIGRGYGRSLLTEQYNLLRFAVFITATFGYFLRRLRFVVTPKDMGSRDTSWRNLWPQLLVVALNALAIPVGLYLHWHSDTLPLSALIANVLWAGAALGIGLTAVRFAMRLSMYQRREYRFPLPLPVQITTRTGLVTAQANDISPLGFRLLGLAENVVRVGDELNCRLLLPGASLQVTATVRSSLPAAQDAAHVTAVLGCEITAITPADRNQLELFLFGSDLQWRLNGLEDRVLTPLERLHRRLRGSGMPHRPLTAGQPWSPIVYQDRDGGHPQVAFISAGENGERARTVVALSGLPRHHPLKAAAVTPTGSHGVTGRLADEHVVETHGAPLYLYTLTT